MAMRHRAILLLALTGCSLKIRSGQRCEFTEKDIEQAMDFILRCVNGAQEANVERRLFYSEIVDACTRTAERLYPGTCTPQRFYLDMGEWVPCDAATPGTIAHDACQSE